MGNKKMLISVEVTILLTLKKVSKGLYVQKQAENSTF